MPGLSPSPGTSPSSPSPEHHPGLQYLPRNIETASRHFLDQGALFAPPTLILHPCFRPSPSIEHCFVLEYWRDFNVEHPPPTRCYFISASIFPPPLLLLAFSVVSPAVLGNIHFLTLSTIRMYISWSSPWSSSIHLLDNSGESKLP